MTYQEALDFLFEQLPMYQRVGQVAYKKDLSNTIKLLDFLDNPHRKFKSIHIAGTNGKGSSAHLLASVLTASGYKTGLYTSPHLRNFTERIRIDGREADKAFVVGFVNRIKSILSEVQPSFFELTVAMAFEYFSENQVDMAVIETGLGGRLDSTNVIMPEVCLITNIGFDHMDLLGDTLPEIAAEKAGIIKPHTPVVIGAFQEEVNYIFEDKAKSENSKLILADANLSQKFLDKPYHIRLNFPGVKAVIDELLNQDWNIDESTISNGIDHVNELSGLKGRFQRVGYNPLMLADVSHNVDGLRMLFQELSQFDYKELYLVFATTVGKDVEELLSIFPKAKYYWTESKVPRSLSSDKLQSIGKEKGYLGARFDNVNQVIDHIQSIAHADDLVLITGSTFMISEIDGL